MDLLLQQGGATSATTTRTSPRCRTMRHYPHLRMTSQPLTPEYLAAQDCVLIATDHSAYDWPWIVEHAPLVVDTRNATRGVAAHRDRVVRA